MNAAVKYPRTGHFSFSPGLQNDDRVLQSLNGFVGHEIVVTEKFDGENTSLYTDRFHARSLDSRHHPSRDWVKSYWGSFKHLIPCGWRVCGENLYATHSIHYTDLMSYFYGFSIWDERNISLSWDDTLLWFEELGITPVHQFYRGSFNLKTLNDIVASLDTERHEGFVVRIVNEIPFDRFGEVVGKWVRAGHVQTSVHWLNQPMIPNELMSTKR